MKTKKIFLAVACALVVASCGQKKGQAEGTGAAADSPQTEQDADYKVCSVDEISEGWAKQDIPVQNGAKQPDIAALLDAFSAVWPTDAATMLPPLENGQKRAFVVTNADAGGSSLIDLTEGYACVMPGDTPEETLQAALWRRTNGHTLLGIAISADEDEIRHQVLCFYDYDPKTQTLKPETDNAVLKFRPAKGSRAEYVLPEQGTALIAAEGVDDDYQFTWSVFEWDGMKFSKVNSYTDNQMLEALDGVWMNEDDSFPFTFRAEASLEEGGSLGISDCGIYGSTEYEVEHTLSQGKLQVFELADEEQDPSYRRALECGFYLTKDGKLRGGYYIRQPGDREWRGIMTLVKKEAGQEEQAEVGEETE